MKTTDELKQLAMDIIDGKVFLSSMVNPQELIPQVFMALMFLNKEQVEKWNENRAFFLYEYYSQASPANINGYPVFTSFNALSEDETLSLNVFMKEYKMKKEEFLKNV